ncbi:FAD/NAD-P-binding domain-containing protein [Hymenopellis radicata]|nr:FAD/NAD-P-binding domain-containing protein [Hymenopellis radicata]
MSQLGTMDPHRLPILIVGGGPAGLISALTLSANGVPFHIIDRRETFHEGIRGTALQPRTLELLQSLGLFEDVKAISTPPYLMAVHAAGREIASEVNWADEAHASPSIPHPGPVTVNQSVFEGVELGIELVDVRQGDEQVTAKLKSKDGEYEESYAYVIAADGAKGSIRSLLGISFLGESKESDLMFTANIKSTDIDPTHWHRWGVFGEKIFFLKPVVPAPMFHVQAMGANLPDPLPQSTEEIQAMFNDISQSQDIHLTDATCISVWRANIRMADKFRAGRVFLVGDSAHCHSPAGGQGSNTGMLDAVNISWKLSAVFKGLALPTLLDTYEAERMPVVAEMLNLTKQLHHLAFTRMPTSTLEGRQTAERYNDPMWRPKHTLQLGVNYRWSPIVLEGRAIEATAEKSPYGIDGAKLRAGDRAPDATSLRDIHTGSEATLFSLVSGTNIHTILIFAGLASIDFDEVQSNYSNIARVLAVFPSSVGHLGPPLSRNVRGVSDSARTAYTAYEVDERECTYVVIRPDGFIGAFAKRPEQIQSYFSEFIRLP